MRGRLSYARDSWQILDYTICRSLTKLLLSFVLASGVTTIEVGTHWRRRKT